MKKLFFGLLISSQVFAGNVVNETVLSSVEIFTDTVRCDGDIFCLDHMRETCNSRKEIINSVFDLAAINDEHDLKRNELEVVAAIRKNGQDGNGDVSEVKKVECKIAVASKNPRYLFRTTLSDKSQHVNECREIMETNVANRKRVLFQELQEGRTLLVRKFCRVYLLELIKK